jgi:hypothetical protein
VPGSAPPRVLEAFDSTYLVVSAVPLEEFGAAAIERRLRDVDWVANHALAHESVVRRFGSAGACDVLPMKLFTIFESEARAVERVRKGRAAIERAFRAVGGCQEWGVRIERERGSRAKAKGGATRPRSSPGRAFLERKRILARGASGASRTERQAAAEAHRSLGGAARRAVRRRPPAGLAPARAPLLDAAYLVPRGSARRFRSIVERCARALRTFGLRAVLTGPWPPYSFVAGGSA